MSIRVHLGGRLGPPDMAPVPVFGGGFLFGGDDIGKPISVLSGGEKARVALAKMLVQPSNLLLMDEPTRGVDVGATQEIHDILRERAGQGKGIIVFSSELPEIVQLCDRIVLMSEGKVRAVLENGKGIDSDRIMALVAGGDASQGMMTASGEERA